MIMGMLAAGGLGLLTDGRRAPDEDNPRGYYELEAVKTLDTPGSDCAWLRQAPGRALKVTSFLLPHLPDSYEYRIVLVRRDLREVLASQRRMLERRGEPAGVRSDEEMARLFADHLSQLEGALGRRRNCRVLVVEHRAALQWPEATARRISEFLGGGLDVQKMVQSIDPGLYRQRVTPPRP